MVDVDLIEQLVSSKNDAVTKLENAYISKDMNYVNRLRVFLFDVQRQIDAVLNGGAAQQNNAGAG